MLIISSPLILFFSKGPTTGSHSYFTDNHKQEKKKKKKKKRKKKKKIKIKIKKKST